MSNYILYSNTSSPSMNATVLARPPNAMPYESIQCRMSRSDPHIRWGFTVRQEANQVVIGMIDHDGLADKAGLKSGDILEQMNGVRVNGASDANREMDTGRLELNMNLQRFMAHPPTVPWSLTEGPDKKLTVNNAFSSGINQNAANTTSMSATSQSHWENPAFKGFNAPITAPLAAPTFGSPSNYSSRYETNNSSYSKTQSQSASGAPFTAPAPLAMPAMPPMPAIPAGGSNFHYVHNTSTKSESKSASGPGVTPADNYSVSSTTNYTDQSGVPPAGFDPNAPFPSFGQSSIGFGNTSLGGGFGSTAAPFGTGTGFGSTSIAPKSGSAAPFGGAPIGVDGAPIGHTSLGQGNFIGGGLGSAGGGFGENRGGPSTFNPKRAQFAPDTNFNAGGSTLPKTPGNVPLNQCTYIQTSGLGAPSPFQKAQSLSPASKLKYQAPSPRTRSQLSPNASIHHLQYNSPMNLYSGEAAAEQYSQQTGLPVSGVPHAEAPYLSSATRQAIAEEEGRFARGTSPAVSPCFKRISNAVGTPVN